MTTRSPKPEGVHASWRIIRITGGYSAAIAVSPPDGDPDDPGIRCIRIASWEIDGHAPFVAHEITSQAAQLSFSGAWDAHGFETPPEEAFPSLAHAVGFVFREYLGRVAESLGVPSPAGGMRSVRIEPDGAGTLWTDVVCGCGRNGLRADGEPHGNFRHRLEPGGKERILACTCGTRFRLRPQRGHAHIETATDDI
jgi:hypothetical protein